jgi:hypothetical protein
MKQVLSFSEWAMTEGITAGATGIIDHKLSQAADVIAKFMNRKTGLGFVQFPFMAYVDGVAGIMYYSSTSDAAFRVGSGAAGTLIGSLDWLDQFWQDQSTFTITSDEFSIVQLVGEFARLALDKKAVDAALQESILVESKDGLLTPEEIKIISRKLDSGESAMAISKSLGVSYGQILKVKKGVKVKEDRSPVEQENEMTLADKVLWMEETMDDVYEITRRVAAGAFNSLFISGRAGTGKTYSVERAMHDEGLDEGEDWIKVSGAVSTIMMYKNLYTYRDKTLVFDDADAVFSNEDGRNILKAALDTKKIRKISYMKKVGMLYDPADFRDNPEGEFNALESGLIPNQFEFAGRVIFISNLPKDKADPDGAIRSRSILIDVNPDDATLMERMRLLLPHLEPKELPLAEKEEIYEFMKQARDISMRTFVKAAGFKLAGIPNWKRMASRYL